MKFIQVILLELLCLREENNSGFVPSIVDTYTKNMITIGYCFQLMLTLFSQMNILPQLSVNVLFHTIEYAIYVVPFMFNMLSISVTSYP